MVESTGFIIFSIYLMLWITKFVDDGAYADYEAAKNEYKEIMFFALILAIGIAPIAGKLADLIPGYIFIPLCSISRSCGAFAFRLIEGPNTKEAKIICAVFLLASYIQ